MEASVILARAWGLFFLTVALAFIVNKKLYQHLLNALGKEGMLYITGFMALLVGVVTVSIHNVWSPDWRGLITLFGWLSIIKGVSRLLWPETVVKSIKQLRVGKYIYFYVVIMIILGAYLTYIGFILN